MLIVALRIITRPTWTSRVVGSQIAYKTPRILTTAFSTHEAAYIIITVVAIDLAEAGIDTGALAHAVHTDNLPNVVARGDILIDGIPVVAVIRLAGKAFQQIIGK